jgi:hypothetical protein
MSSILSSVVSRYQLGFAFHATSLMVPPSAFPPQGTCEAAMNSASSWLTSPANDAVEFRPVQHQNAIHGRKDRRYRRARRRILDQRGYRFAFVERKGSYINQPRHLRIVGLIETGLRMGLLEKSQDNTAFDAEQSVLRSPVCLGIIAKYGHFSRIFRESRQEFSAVQTAWRRERDSNPRYPFRHSGFQDRLFQPLTHPSAGIRQSCSGS